MPSDLFVPFRSSVTLAGGDVAWRSAGWRNPELWVYVVSSRGCSFDPRWRETRLFRPQDRTMLTVVLDGGFVSFRHGEHATRAGDLLIEREPLWLERWEGRFRALVVEWSEHVAPLLLPGIGRVSREDTARVARWAAELEASEVAPLEVIGSLFEWFSSLGFPRTPWPSLASSLSAAPPVVLQVGAAMARLLDEMHRAPQAVDLVSATALHPRTLQRVFAQHQRWLPMTMAQRAHDLRIVLAGSLLASTSATTRVVAEALGYGSGRALLRALDDACYPTVAELRSGGAV